ncbi:MAG TPA: MFS transporter [Syntrophales bacterium]|jgi:MFS family permease|nr:MFS transporter [Syntrophales bacterium]
MLIFRALSYRNYRLFFFGQSISLIGSWMQQIAVTWLVYRMTQSPFLLGLVGFLGTIPSFLLTPFAGVLSDRWSRYRILLVTQTVSMLQALVLAVLVLTGLPSVWPVLFLTLILGCVNAVDMPARHAFVSDMVEHKEDLGYVIAMNSALFNFARLVGPSLAGFLIAWSGEGMCFLINGLSYLAVIAALLGMNLTAVQARNDHPGVLREFGEGVAYVFHDRKIRAILLLLALCGILGIPYVTVMPFFAGDVLHGGPRVLGLLMSAMGTGALAGAVYFASKRSHGGLMRLIPMAMAVIGLGYIGLSWCRSVPIALFFMFVIGVGMVVHFAASNTEVQTVVEDSKRGRVVSLLIFSVMGMMPFGSLLAGALVDMLDIERVFLTGGIGCLLGAGWFIRIMRREGNQPAGLKNGGAALIPSDRAPRSTSDGE